MISLHGTNSETQNLWYKSGTNRNLLFFFQQLNYGISRVQSWAPYQNSILLRPLLTLLKPLYRPIRTGLKLIYPLLPFFILFKPFEKFLVQIRYKYTSFVYKTSYQYLSQKPANNTSSSSMFDYNSKRNQGLISKGEVHGR